MKKISIMISTSFLSLAAYAGISEDMDNFFNSSGMQSNVTGAGAYHGQTAGLYTGGQIYTRNRVRNIYPANIRLPSYSAGCGGIDAFTGSFSFIGGDELVKSLESIASSAGSYAFMLAMETMSPQISGVQKYLSNIANVVNQQNINSCEAASGLVGGIWPKTQVAQHQICTASGSNGGLLSDWAAAKQGCGTGGTTSALSGRAKDKYGDMIVQNKNIAWESISKSGFSNMDTETKELLMTISGTIIIKNEGNDESDNSIVRKPSLAVDKDFIKALMYGGEAIIYKCDETTRCLKPSEENVLIGQEKSFINMVSKTLDGIRDAISVDRALTDKEISFLGSTSLPIYKMFNVEYATGTDLLNIDAYASLIASDILYQYIAENLEMMTQVSKSLHFMDEYMDEYKKALGQARDFLNQERIESHNSFDKTMNLIKQTQQMEQLLAAKLSAHLVSVIGFENGA